MSFLDFDIAELNPLFPTEIVKYVIDSYLNLKNVKFFEKHVDSETQTSQWSSSKNI